MCKTQENMTMVLNPTRLSAVLHTALVQASLALQANYSLAPLAYRKMVSHIAGLLSAEAVKLNHLEAVLAGISYYQFNGQEAKYAKCFIAARNQLESLMAEEAEHRQQTDEGSTVDASDDSGTSNGPDGGDDNPDGSEEGGDITDGFLPDPDTPPSE